MAGRFYHDTRGTYTLEASLIIPVILLMLVSLAFFSMFIYRKLVFHDTAVYIAKQRAATWGNSHRNMESGSLQGVLINDGLYWRIFEDHNGSLLVSKKESGAGAFSAGLLGDALLKQGHPPEVKVEYTNDLVRRFVSVEITGDVQKTPVSPGKVPVIGISAKAVAGVAEPAEFIRNFNLTAGYLSEAVNYLKTFGGQEEKRGNRGSGRRTVVASTESNVNGQKIYHYPGCRYIARIKQENLIEFGSEEEAGLKGFHICMECTVRRAGEY